MYLKVLTVALAGTLGVGGGDWNHANSRVNIDCCALQLDCCNPPSACCFGATSIADCCAQELPCCPDGACCTTATRGVARRPSFSGDCCALNLPCCNPPSECCFGVRGDSAITVETCCCK